MEKLFGQLGLNEAIIQGLIKDDINNPTKIQEEVIPKALLKSDIIAESETGSGKTLAYVLPLFEKLDRSTKDTQAIILLPTHELAIQVHREIEKLARNSQMPIRSAAVVGNVSIKRQTETIKKDKPHIVVSSPGRVLKLIQMKVIKAHTVKTIIIDEADRLLDKSNLAEIKAVIKTTLKERQLMLFSATITNKTLEIAKEMVKEDYQLIKVDQKTVINENITHMFFSCTGREKINTLRKLMHILKPQKAIAFINIAYEIENALESLKYHGLRVEAIYGKIGKEERKKALQNFQTGKVNLLIASDLAARGLDIKDVDYIFSIDIPDDAENYLHRAGRTARAGKEGVSISIITDREKPLMENYQKKLKIKIEAKDMEKGKIIDVNDKH
ncbi:DEAD/DEAH box helicase [Metallumcola ferriviriculae]|uniref:DEAD/DEAH box helicase n=1 Tax=Metallumcola ferriviriculae TaxID=3039180 RepID=A0AAU0UII8_9FIRM|nr:DEAD/DEAH box helicase [Desulfitibacteraceae bacterium MK1]